MKCDHLRRFYDFWQINIKRSTNFTNTENANTCPTLIYSLYTDLFVTLIYSHSRSVLILVLVKFLSLTNVVSKLKFYLVGGVGVLKCTLCEVSNGRYEKHFQNPRETVHSGRVSLGWRQKNGDKTA